MDKLATPPLHRQRSLIDFFRAARPPANPVASSGHRNAARPLLRELGLGFLPYIAMLIAVLALGA
jgi:hypothetical protein